MFDTIIYYDNGAETEEEGARGREQERPRPKVNKCARERDSVWGLRVIL